MEKETREKAARALCSVLCMGSPKNHNLCYFPKAYIVGHSYSFFRHVAEQRCIEYGLPISSIELLTIQDAWIDCHNMFMPNCEQAKINYDIEIQKIRLK